MNLIKCADIPDHFEKIYNEEYQFYLKSKDDKKWLLTQAAMIEMYARLATIQ